MVASTTSPVPGPISGMPPFGGVLTGAELFPLVVPPFGVSGSNQKITSQALASGLIGVLPPENPNTVLAGPSSGLATAIPSFRLLVAADMPLGTAALPLVGNGTVAPSYQVLTVPGGGVGTTTLTQNGVVFGNGSATVGITGAGNTALVLISPGPLVAPAFGQVSLTAAVTGVLGVPNGGTNTSTLTPFGVLTGNGTSTVGITGAGTTGWPLVGNGTALAPSFQQINITAAFTGILPVTLGGTNTSILTAFGVVYGNGSSTIGITAAGTATYLLVGNGSAAAPAFQQPSVVNGYLATQRLITAIGTIAILTTDCRVLFTTAAAGTSTVRLPDATLAPGPILIKDIKGNASATGPMNMTFTSSQLADGLSTVSITVPYGAYWFNPKVIGTTGGWYITVA